MRHRERRDLQRTQHNGLAVPGNAQQSVEVGFADAHVGAPAHPDGNAFAQRELAGTTDVVAVFVRDEDRVDVLGEHAGLPQPLVQLAHTQAAVDQQMRKAAGVAGLHHRRVARASAAQAFESQHAVRPLPLSAGRPQSPGRCAARWPRPPVRLRH